MGTAYRLGSLLAAGLLALSGCAGASTSEAPASPSPAAFTNPVYPSNFPDPMIVPDPAGGFWAVATNGNGSNVQTLRSTDLTSWEQGPDALPELPDWTSPGKVWAPEVEETADQGYPSLLHHDRHRTRRSSASASRSGRSRRDPSPTTAAGRWSARRTRAGPSTPTRSPPPAGSATSTGRTTATRSGWTPTSRWPRSMPPAPKLVGKPTRLFKQDLPWEGDLVEAPFVWEHEGRFHLFYSANAYASDAYAVGHAVADSPLGPFTKEPGAGAGQQRRSGRAGSLLLVRPERPGLDGLPRLDAGRDRLRRPRPGDVAERGHLRRRRPVSVVPPTVDYPTRP